MMKRLALLAACLAASATFADAKNATPFRVHADRIAVDAKTSAVSVSGQTMFTTCTNELGCLHWSASGEGSGERDRYVELRNMWVKLFGVPVLWLPYWYQPLDTDYGWRVMPGYTSRWGAYLMTKYVYRIAGDSAEGHYGLSGSTRFDLRSENGVAVGQGLKWRLGEFGKGKIKFYYAWDEDADRYDRHWSSRDWNYRNWGSTVPSERYAVELSHLWTPTERDTVHLTGSVYSDSHFRNDFLRESTLGLRNRFVGHHGNELAWEHIERVLGFGVSVSGPLNDFYGGTSRLPEFFIDVAPTPVLDLPVNYESRTSVGYYDRDYARYGNSLTSLPFRYSPGVWADYNTFRFDTYHRLTLPFRVADVVSVVPRVGVRGTYWNDSGRTVLDGASRATSTGKEVWRSIVEGGVTFSARGTAWIDEQWQHMVEPYLDILCQEASYSGLGGNRRPYVFDGADASRDWQDQFAGRSRNLPYSWYGATPGVRNAWRKADEDGNLRTVVDLDVYAAIQFNDTSYTSGGKAHCLAKDPEDPNYGDDTQVVPGVRTRWFVDKDTMLAARAEYDSENSKLAYAEVEWRQRLTERFSYYVEYSGRDYRWWDYSTTPTSAELRSEDFNRVDFQFLELGFEQEFCDALAWSPYLKWDCREGEFDEVGAWFDVRTDCLGFRLELSYENDYTRIDGSKSRDDWRCGFYIYLRCVGPGNGSPLGGD